MKIEHPNAQPLTQAELEDLEKLEHLIKQAVIDGKVTPYELQQINVAIHADGKVLFQELDLVQRFICEKLNHGQIGFER
ncbi:hypothetical protein BST81_11940 [Leptolyngbya sp. 'hensonii']|uniref:hypothetical protein n=1 Tax=Leptolyngbya sp. 'hensonii' TaxID=1922337 RepID=UPI00094F4C99|nr:hypothetical protein [Leptolyngbya sp. 'hensonii']OLP18170.1 hypothetical protein BST81_11940 [Leptolyngbya sp. 'hensonii']